MSEEIFNLIQIEKHLRARLNDATITTDQAAKIKKKIIQVYKKLETLLYSTEFNYYLEKDVE